MAAKARRATTAKLPVVKIFGFRSLNNPRVRLVLRPEFRRADADMQTAVSARLYLFAVAEGRLSRPNQPQMLAQYFPVLQHHGKNNWQYVQPSKLRLLNMW